MRCRPRPQLTVLTAPTPLPMFPEGKHHTTITMLSLSVVTHLKAARLVTLIAKEDLFRSPADEAYVTVTVGQHRETHPVTSTTFKRYFAARYYDRYSAPPDPTALKSALDVIEGHALFRGDIKEVFVRVGGHNGKVYLDLGDQTWDVMEISRTGWYPVKEAPIKFRRPAGMQPLPKPERGGSIDELRPFLNLASEEDFILVVAFLVGTLLPTGPYAHLQLVGEQGSGKSSLARIVRSLVDSNTVPLRGQVRNERDLMIAARNGWLLVFDNLSWLPAWLSDALCRLSTGGGFSTRQLYTDVDETLIDVQQPALINGITGVAVRGDLLDRTISLELPSIPPAQRKPERQFWEHFEKVRPRVLGVLLDAVSRVLRDREKVRLVGHPRLADFAVAMAAAEPAFGWPEGTFAQAYAANQHAARARAVESDPVALLVEDLMQKAKTWSGTATQLLDVLKRRTHAVVVWVPRDPARLSQWLRRLKPDLKAVGIEVTFSREGRHGTRMIHISRADDTVSTGTNVSGDGASNSGDGSDGPSGASA